MWHWKNKFSFQFFYCLLFTKFFEQHWSLLNLENLNFEKPLQFENKKYVSFNKFCMNTWNILSDYACKQETNINNNNNISKKHHPQSQSLHKITPWKALIPHHECWNYSLSYKIWPQKLIEDDTFRSNNGHITFPRLLSSILRKLPYIELRVKYRKITIMWVGRVRCAGRHIVSTHDDFWMAHTKMFSVFSSIVVINFFPSFSFSTDVNG